MNDEKLDYLIKLSEAQLQSSEEAKAICLQNNLMLREILSKFNSPSEDAKDIVLDVIGNLAAYNMIGGDK